MAWSLESSHFKHEYVTSLLGQNEINLHNIHVCVLFVLKTNRNTIRVSNTLDQDKARRLSRL